MIVIRNHRQFSRPTPPPLVAIDKFSVILVACLLPQLSRTLPITWYYAGFYLRFIVWGRSPEWTKATSFLGRSRGLPTGNCLKRICAEMQSGAFWDTILRNVTVCALTSSRTAWFFRYSYLYTVMITIFFSAGGKLSILGESFYHSNTLDRNLLWLK